MKPHTKLYHKVMNFFPGEYIPCEVCASKAVDIHHIYPRGMGGSKIKDFIENLMALCRICHEKYGDKENVRDFLIMKHAKAMSQRGFHTTVSLIKLVLNKIR